MPDYNRATLLMRQASMTAHSYMTAAKKDIDDMFGDGYAKAHPELVGAYMQTAAMDYFACFQADHLEELTGTISMATEEASRTLGSAISEGLNKVGEALDKVAAEGLEAIDPEDKTMGHEA